ncbi:TonB-dependent receptor [Flavilitoribacter nigricans]|uniref:TonB-dependent receptor n=1 Tax=Flavilitoribacter nigricans (strain ATCC 23147 / DSM 23189 / NBRC 102662 / NCIMB 1420 / SS-2) TaxID=1122177 RepID=A0A2D0N4E6_FLAN2|nr:TonB-dependent receptor [Flavilitoribacter nigricans]PHN03317.1 TonB-dependent receptor [Flavilitoribacter nigricans DSM 23189 = NBRC 102662]
MNKYLLILFLLGSATAYTQHSFRAYIKDEHSQTPLIGATVQVEGTALGTSSDEQGLVVIEDIPAGRREIVISFVGYQDFRAAYEFPLANDHPLTIFLEEGEEMEEITVTATRSSRTIEEIPTRIEFLGAEELAEKAVMNSTNIAMLLRESTGIQMQQTSASSANQSIRIQGLDGRYTQILKDGFPLFGGFSGGLSIMQIPPLDLQQVEVIKGSASTLYGGGAIAGLINLVTKKPVAERPELSLMLNQTSAGGTTANGFYAQRGEKAGLSLYASANRQEPYDPNEDGFSDIPRVRSLTFTPRFFLYPDENTTLWLGVNTTLENRIGGDLQVIDGTPDTQHTFSEENRSQRFSTQLSLDRTFANDALLRVRNSVGFFDREVIIPNYQFSGRQLASFSEVSYAKEGVRAQWTIGANLFTDRFRENSFGNFQKRDYENTTLGAFAQHTWDLSDALALESGLRTDLNSQYGTFVLPRVSLLFQLTPRFSGRIGGGLGYKLPTIFTEEAEGRTFRDILPISSSATAAERSVGGNVDLNYETVIGDQVTFSINQLFFYTRLNDALVLQQNEGPTNFRFTNADGTIDSKGFETNIKFTYLDFKLFLQYAFIDARLNYLNTNNQKPLTPRHNAGAVLVFEQHGKWRLGLESYYTGRQFRSDFSQTRDYWIVGFMALRQLNHFSLFLNFENFIDTRQSRYQEIVRPPVNDPTFAEIWAPTDGFVINGGFIWNLFAKEEEHHH